MHIHNCLFLPSGRLSLGTKRDITHVYSHELRTPMAAVIGLLDILLCDDCLSNEQYARITQIRKCSTALLRLLNNILDLSKVESGKLVLEEAEFDLGRELEGLIDMFSVQCINHNVEIVLDLSDDMPKLVRGDSARVIQIFANLISNSIKFTSSGHIILRGWCENSNFVCNMSRNLLNQHEIRAAPMKSKQQQSHAKNASKRDKKAALWFEVDDTGCGIDAGKWESVFESFEQGDPSTTRKHGGTGLGLCIVKTLVNKMGGEIEVIKKDGPGTLMKFYLLLNPSLDNAVQHSQMGFSDHKLVVLLALGGSMGRSIMSQWLQKKGIFSWQASEWNELTQILKEVFRMDSVQGTDNNDLRPRNEILRDEFLDMGKSVFIIVIDIALLDLSTNIWKEQLNYLSRYSKKVKFAWILNHNTSNSVKLELRQKGHHLMVNKPLYKAKMTQILEAVIKEKNHEQEKSLSEAVHECFEVDPVHYDGSSSEDSDKTGPCCGSEVALQPQERRAKVKRPSFSQSAMVKNYLVGFTEELQNDLHDPDQAQAAECSISGNEGTSNTRFHKVVNEKRGLEGLRILLAEDTPVLQRVATIMLERLGATVVVVGDGVEAVNALNAQECQTQRGTSFPVDLVLMDCQMPKMDGYEATKAIRESESGTGSHIPIVALTAHAMTCDEAKCLEVGMDAYLTKPIDCKLMVSTILSLTRTNDLA